jgi:hypothetical protein
MNKIYRKFAIGLIVLIILAPLGLFAFGETFGEWAPVELKEKLGFVPQGLAKLSDTWSAPFQGYGFPGHESQTDRVVAYILAAAIGVVVCGGVLFLVGRKVAKD